MVDGKQQREEKLEEYLDGDGRRFEWAVEVI